MIFIVCVVGVGVRACGDGGLGTSKLNTPCITKESLHQYIPLLRMIMGWIIYYLYTAHEYGYIEL
jgi:hypothetical protein